MQPEIDYCLLSDGTFSQLTCWTCPTCKLTFTPNIYNQSSLHIVDSERCLNIKNDVICNKHEYGQQITVVCTKCHGLYITKNISYIGARGIFMNKPAITCSECDFVHICFSQFMRDN